MVPLDPIVQGLPKESLERDWRGQAESAFKNKDFDSAFDQWKGIVQRLPNDALAKERLETSAGHYFAKGLKSPEMIEKVLENFRQVVEKLPSLRKAVEPDLASRWMTKEEAEFGSAEAKDADRVAVLLRIHKFAPQFMPESGVTKRYETMRSRYFSEAIPRITTNLKSDGDSGTGKVTGHVDVFKNSHRTQMNQRSLRSLVRFSERNLGKRSSRKPKNISSSNAGRRPTKFLQKLPAVPEYDRIASKTEFPERRRLMELIIKVQQLRPQPNSSKRRDFSMRSL